MTAGYGLLSIIFITCLLASKGFSDDNKGLVGLLYDDINLTRVSSVWRLESLDSDKASWPAKNDFSAKWSGYFKMPVDGEIQFSAEADNEVQLRINNRIIVNTWEGEAQTSGKFNAEKDKTYKVSLQYRQISGDSYMRVFWSWAGQKKQIVPVSALSYDKEMEEDASNKFSSKINVNMSDLDFDVASIISIHSAQDVIKKRNALIEVLWGKAGFPFKKQPDSVITGISDTDFVSLANIKRIDKLCIEMESGFNSICYHFVPEKNNRSAAIYHQGHGGKFNIGISTIRAFLEKGYDVFALSMPLLGMNRKPVVWTERFGKLILHSHNQMMLLESGQGHPVKYFMEPVAAVCNYAQKFNFKRLIMSGLSGGGWTTTLYAAIDPRIQISFPVAGTLPHYLRARDFAGNGSIGDYEQSAPEIYRVANYLELYIMGSYGKNRRQHQILNEFDSCCFRGTGFTSYKDIVKDRVQMLGDGRFDVSLDSTHRRHQISPRALEIIFNDLQNDQE